jgi:hypothetical protein
LCITVNFFARNIFLVQQSKSDIFSKIFRFRYYRNMHVQDSYLILMSAVDFAHFHLYDDVLSDFLYIQTEVLIQAEHCQTFLMQIGLK